MGKIVLWVSAIVFTIYGLICLFWPEVPAGYAGLIMTDGTAIAEISAMYGGLQTGFGIFCFIAALKPSLQRPGLLLLTLCIGLLGLTRVYSTVLQTDPVSTYTWGALCFELSIATVAALALKKT